MCNNKFKCIISKSDDIKNLDRIFRDFSDFDPQSKL